MRCINCHKGELRPGQPTFFMCRACEIAADKLLSMLNTGIDVNYSDGKTISYRARTKPRKGKQ